MKLLRIFKTILRGNYEASTRIYHIFSEHPKKISSGLKSKLKYGKFICIYRVYGNFRLREHVKLAITTFDLLYFININEIH